MKTILLAALAFFVLACGGPSGEKESIPALKKEVMALHDEVMPKMGDLRKTEKALRDMAEISADSTVLLQAAENLRSSNGAMMDWMRGYEPEFSGSDDEVLTYLKDQKAKIGKVKEDMISALEKGQSLIAP